MPENNEAQYELDENYEPLGIVDAADGSGTTWPEFVEQVNKMDNQVAALTQDRDSRTQQLLATGETTSFTATEVDLSDVRLIALVCMTSDDKRWLSTTVVPVSEFVKHTTATSTVDAVYGGAANIYFVKAYYNDGRVYLKSTSNLDRAELWKLM